MPERGEGQVGGEAEAATLTQALPDLNQFPKANWKLNYWATYPSPEVYRRPSVSRLKGWAEEKKAPEVHKTNELRDGIS